jgi:[acyl-carrier-protein] S-malonyltransferase
LRTAFLFPGQGEEAARVVSDWYGQSEKVRDLVDISASLLGRTAIELLAKGGRRLSRTEVYQPVVTAVGLGICRELRSKGIRPFLTAGHSMGELAALSASGCISSEDAIRLAAKRGHLMLDAATENAGGMIALVEASQESVKEAIALGLRFGQVQLAACNAPSEWVLTGDQSALQIVASKYRAVNLRVAGAWHGSHMRGAVEEFRRILKDTKYMGFENGFICNRTGEQVNDSIQIPDLLAEQLIHPIQWARTLDTITRAGVANLITIGSGKVLRALARKNLGNQVRVHSTQAPDDFLRVVEVYSQWSEKKPATSEWVPT